MKGETLSRAFVDEDSGGDKPLRTYHLPPRDDPDFDRSVVRELLEGARVGDTVGAEEATGHKWGDPRLVPIVRQFMHAAEANGDERLAQVAARYLKQADRK
jgi:hypothetical protein